MRPNPTAKPNPPEMLTCDASFPPANREAVKKKILVVDDDPQIRQSLQKVLRAEGYEVVLAADGREGIEKFDTEQIDLLLLDVSLPDISGWDVFETVTSRNAFVPIIIITGRSEQHQLAVWSGVGALVVKPLDFPRLLETVKEILAESPEVHLQRLAGRRSDVRHTDRHAAPVNYRRAKSAAFLRPAIPLVKTGTSQHKKI
jgi:DNA-binding response OmpR family regulator